MCTKVEGAGLGQESGPTPSYHSFETRYPGSDMLHEFPALHSATRLSKEWVLAKGIRDLVIKYLNLFCMMGHSIS